MRELEIPEIEIVSGGETRLETVVVTAPRGGSQDPWLIRQQLEALYGNDYGNLLLQTGGGGGGGGESAPSESENSEDESEHPCGERVTAPDGSEYFIPHGYTLFEMPGAQGHVFMEDADGNLHATPWWEDQAAANADALDDAAWTVGLNASVWGAIMGNTTGALALDLLLAAIHGPHGGDPIQAPENHCNGS